MNRIFSKSLVALALSFAFPAFAFASVISLSPASIPVTPGKVFTVRVVVNPQGAKVYTASANVSFDKSLVKVDKFTPASGWTFAVPGGKYSNTTGTLTEGAGLIGGFTSPKLLGTITFTAKKVGTARISITAKSTALNTENKNTISGTQGSSAVVITIPPLTKQAHKTVKKVVKSTKKNTVVAKQIAVEAVATTTVAVASTTATTTEATTSAITALPLQASAAGTTSSNTKFALIALAVLAVIIGLWMNRKRFSSKKF